MKISSRIFLPYLLGVVILLFSNSIIAYGNDSLASLILTNVSTVNTIETSITEDYKTIKNIIPHLVNKQGYIVEIREIIVNYDKVEKLWIFHEEAKQNGSYLPNSPLTKELAYLSKYTLFLLNESLDKILLNLNNEPLRLELVKWKTKKLAESKIIYQQDKKDLNRLETMKPSVMENPMITNTNKLANLLSLRDSLYSNRSSSKVPSEFRKNQGKKKEEIDLFYSCDVKKRKVNNAPENIMDFSSDQAINIIRLDREIFKFRQIALASLPYKEQQYFQLKKELSVAAYKEKKEFKRKLIKKKTDDITHHSLILKEYNKLIDSFSFEEQNKLRAKEKIYNHEVISVIEFWGCPDFFPSFYNK